MASSLSGPPRRRPTRLHLFDLDGTLIHGSSAAVEISHQLGLDAEIRELELAFAAGGMTPPDFAARACALWSELTEEHIDAAFMGAPWLGGIREVWDEIRERGERSAVISLSPDFFVSRLLIQAPPPRPSRPSRPTRDSGHSPAAHYGTSAYYGTDEASDTTAKNPHADGSWATQQGSDAIAAADVVTGADRNAAARTGVHESVHRSAGSGGVADGGPGRGADATYGSRWPSVPFREPLDPAGILSAEAKVRIADELCAKFGVSRGDCVAYGDSMSDAALFAAVPVSVAVNADGHVRGLASAEYEGEDLREAFGLVRKSP
jgi:phosphoserine phosphatase